METNGSIDSNLCIQMDKLNDILLRIIKIADNQCQKGRRGKIPSSPVINRAKGTIRILRLVLRRWIEKGKKHRPKMTRLQRLAKKYKYQGKLSFNTLEESGTISWYLQQYICFQLQSQTGLLGYRLFDSIRHCDPMQYNIEKHILEKLQKNAHKGMAKTWINIIACLWNKKR